MVPRHCMLAGILVGNLFRDLRPLSQTGSTPAGTNLSPFARCTLGLNRHFFKKKYIVR